MSSCEKQPYISTLGTHLVPALPGNLKNARNNSARHHLSKECTFVASMVADQRSRKQMRIGSAFAALTLSQTLTSASHEGRGRTLSGSGYGNTGQVYWCVQFDAKAL